ncbi:hypothetical protein ED733_004995 [Metarhizium rileyi]|uniref:Uncharacterized protein n=1 Tax=Metarhizium rileyi (strain RCEF 4871) TaxID=1649241 RepID=A0A5C6G8D4_METRR|nr:hypothetical protein ED733_004995 [Metarhizium rileyi]
MRFTSTAILLTSLVASLQAGVVPEEKGDALENREADSFLGSFEVHSDKSCHQGGSSVTVTSGHRSGALESNVHAVRAYLHDCRLFIWNRSGGGPVLHINRGDNNCHPIPGTARFWQAFCP